MKSIIVWLALMIVGTNLIGFIVRGFLQPLMMVEAPSEQVEQSFARETGRMSVANVLITSVAIFATVAYFFALAYFWNLGLFMAAGMLIAARVPDLLWEIRIGQRITRFNRPKGIVHAVSTLTDWLALPMTWLSLCAWPY